MKILIGILMIVHMLFTVNISVDFADWVKSKLRLKGFFGNVVFGLIMILTLLVTFIFIAGLFFYPVIRYTKAYS